MLKGGSGEGSPPPGTAAVSKHEIKSVTQHQGACSRGGSGGFPPPGTAAVSKHETKSVTQHQAGGMLEGGVREGVSPPGTATVCKHETGTMTKQTTGVLQFMVTFALRGRVGNTSGNISHFVVPWEAGGPYPNQHASDLYHNF